MTAKEKKKLFDVMEFASVEQAQKEYDKQRTLFIVKGIGTLVALIGTIITIATMNHESVWPIALCVGLVGEAVACLGYKGFIYFIKIWWNTFIFIPMVFWLPIGAMLGAVLGVFAIVYLPVIGAAISFFETYRNYNEAKEYLELHQTIAQVANAQEAEYEAQTQQFAQPQPAPQAQPVVNEVAAEPVVEAQPVVEEAQPVVEAQTVAEPVAAEPAPIPEPAE